jgi:hypothetical protein
MKMSTKQGSNVDKHLGNLWSISPTFYEQLLRQYPNTQNNKKNKLKQRKSAHLTFVQKSCSKNVGEIDSRLNSRPKSHFSNIFK